MRELFIGTLLSFLFFIASSYAAIDGWIVDGYNRHNAHFNPKNPFARVFWIHELQSKYFLPVLILSLTATIAFVWFCRQEPNLNSTAWILPALSLGAVVGHLFRSANPYDLASLLSPIIVLSFWGTGFFVLRLLKAA